MKERTLEWPKYVWKKYFILACQLVCMHAPSLSHSWLFATPWTVAHQAPVVMGFPRQESLSGLPFPFLGNLSNQASNPVFCISCIARQILYHCATWEGNQLVCCSMILLPQLLRRSVLTRHQTSSSWISTESLHFVSELKICILLLLFQIAVIMLFAKILERKLVAFWFWDEW